MDGVLGKGGGGQFTDGRSILLHELQQKQKFDRLNSTIADLFAWIATFGFLATLIVIFLEGDLRKLPLIEQFSEMDGFAKNAVSTLLGIVATSAFMNVEKARQNKIKHLCAMALLLDHGVVAATDYLKKSEEKNGVVGLVMSLLGIGN